MEAYLSIVKLKTKSARAALVATRDLGARGRTPRSVADARGRADLVAVRIAGAIADAKPYNSISGQRRPASGPEIFQARTIGVDGGLAVLSPPTLALEEKLNEVITHKPGLQSLSVDVSVWVN